MKFTQVVPLLFSSLVLAAPAAVPALVPDKTINARAATICGEWDTVVTGAYTVYQNLWNKGTASSGSQCSTFSSLSGSTIAWSSSWSWAGASNQVKSYANVALTKTAVQLKSIASIPSIWKYSYTGTSMVVDVSYDIFTSSTATGGNEFEIMIWLAAIGGAGPISSTGSPIASPTINGVKWNLFKGPNGDVMVYSFVAQSQVTSYSGDLNLFFTYLVSNNGFSINQYIITLQAGTEPFTGSNAVFSVSEYSVAINTQAVVASSSTKTSTKSSSTSTKASTTSTKVSTTTTKAATITTKASTTTTKASTTSTKPATTTTAASTGGTIPKYYQCGGSGFTGGTCVAGTTCVFDSVYYSQCR